MKVHYKIAMHWIMFYATLTNPIFGQMIANFLSQYFVITLKKLLIYMKQFPNHHKVHYIFGVIFLNNTNWSIYTINYKGYSSHYNPLSPSNPSDNAQNKSTSNHNQINNQTNKELLDNQINNNYNIPPLPEPPDLESYKTDEHTFIYVNPKQFMCIKKRKNYKNDESVMY